MVFPDLHGSVLVNTEDLTQGNGTSDGMSAESLSKKEICFLESLVRK